VAQILVDQLGDFGHGECLFSVYSLRFPVGRDSAPAINQTLKYEKSISGTGFQPVLTGRRPVPLIFNLFSFPSSGLGTGNIKWLFNFKSLYSKIAFNDFTGRSSPAPR
jgi:hypothetical protein